MNRRQFLTSLAAVGGYGMSSMCFSNQSIATSNQAQQTYHAFNAARQHNPALIGFTGNAAEKIDVALTIEGKLPCDIRGVLYRNGPTGLSRGDQRYQHLFEGDGMIHRIAISDQGMQHHSRYVRTPKFIAEAAAGRLLYDGPQTTIAASRAITSADSINTANTSVIPVNGKLWALWEAGSPTQLDATTLATDGFVNLGQGTALESQLKAMPFSAHPKITADGHLWNFGFRGGNRVVLYHFNPQGQLQKAKPIDTGYGGSMIHDFLVTQKHLLLILPSLTIGEDPYAGYFERIKFAPDQAMRVLVIDKHNFEITQEYELPPAFAFHFGNAWEEANGTIHFDASLYPDATIIGHLGQIMHGNADSARSKADHTLITLRPNQPSRLEHLAVSSEFPVIADHLTGQYNRYLYFVSSETGTIWHSKVHCYDDKTQQLTEFDYGSDYLIEEHLAICPTHNESKTYLIGTAIHVPSQRSCVSIFNAAKLSDGPIVRAWLPYSLPLGFHGKFVAT